MYIIIIFFISIIKIEQFGASRGSKKINIYKYFSAKSGNQNYHINN